MSAPVCDERGEGVCGVLKSRNKQITTTKVEQSPAGLSHVLRAEGTVADIMSWYDVMIWYHDMISWCGTTISYHDIASWYHIMMSYHDIIPWCHVMILYHDSILWYYIMISYQDIISWYHIMISSHDIISWYHIMWPWQSRGHIPWFLYRKYTIFKDCPILEIDN